MSLMALESVLLHVFDFFGTRAYVAPEFAFWNWFCAHESRLFALRTKDDPLLAHLGSLLEAVHPDLGFELGTTATGRRELVISANGRLRAFPAVERLCAVAPDLAAWRCVRFRPRRTPLHGVDFGGRSVAVEDVRCVPVRDGRRVGVFLFLRHYEGREQALFRKIAQLLLDETLGELAVAHHLGFVELEPWEARYFSHSIPLSSLPAAFDAACSCHP